MMMRHVISDRLEDLSALYEDVELISVRRPATGTLSLVSRAGEWLARGEDIEARWTQSVQQPEAANKALGAVRDPQFRAALGDEITEAVQVLTDLLNCTGVGIRAATLRGPMCPRFHADLVPCRMLITLTGPGTEWIAHDEVDVECFADRNTDRVPVQAGGHVRTLDTGAWSVLKGGRWDHRFAGVVHRSPHEEARRLLVSFDPLFSSG